MDTNVNEVANEVIEKAVEESVANIGAGTVLTGVCAATGAVTIVYGAIKGVKWLTKKVKTMKDAKYADCSAASETEFEDTDDSEN